MKYPLEQVAIIKQKKCDEAEKVLKEKKNALIKEEEKLASLTKERDKVKEHRQAKLDQLRERLDAGERTDKIQQMKQYMKVVQENLKVRETKVKEQQKQVEAAEKQVETARQDYIKKQHEVEKLALHRKEWEKEQKLLEEQKESLETDELGSAMHVLRKYGKNSRHGKR